MNEIIHEWEESKDGILYDCKAFSDGHIERRIKEGYEDAITDTEQRTLDLEMNVQYLVDLAEINMEEM